MSSGWKFEVIQKTIEDENNQLNVSMLCDIAGVSRSGYYRWVNAADVRKEKEKRDREDFELILKAYSQHGYSKGARSIYMSMLHWNPPVVMNVKKIRRLMDKYGLMCPIRKANPYRRMAKALKTNNVADNLLNRNFKEYGPRRVLLTDITYIPYEGKFAYLSTILDAYTKQILSYVLSDSLEVDFVLETVEKLVKTHGIELTKETLIHSDQGCHYTSTSFIRLVNDKDLRQSMSRKGNCWDNAPQESFFGHMKDEIDVSDCKKFREVKDVIDDWLEYYNNSRYQWQLAKLSPNEYYEYITTGVYPLEGIVSNTENEHIFPNTDGKKCP
jgi:transposase InsO family protein